MDSHCIEKATSGVESQLTPLVRLKIEIEFLKNVEKILRNLIDEKKFGAVISSRFDYIPSFTPDDDKKLFDSNGEVHKDKPLIVQHQDLDRFSKDTLKLYGIMVTLSARERFILDAILFTVFANFDMKYNQTLFSCYDKSTGLMNESVAIEVKLFKDRTQSLCGDIINNLKGETGFKRPGEYKVNDELLQGIANKLKIKNALYLTIACLSDPKIDAKWLTVFNDELNSPTNNDTSGFFKRKNHALMELAQLFKKFIQTNNYDETLLKAALEKCCAVSRQQSPLLHSDLADLLEEKFTILNKSTPMKKLDSQK